MAAAEPGEGSGASEEPYEWAWDANQNKWVKVTARNSNGRKCGQCGCACPCTCPDCLYQCCS